MNIAQEAITCPLCDRPIINFRSRHHLIPECFGGKEVVVLHKICHDKIHSVFSERELLKHFHTIARIREHEDMQKFIKWVSKKEPDFHDNNAHTATRYSKFRNRHNTRR